MKMQKFSIMILLLLSLASCATPARRPIPADFPLQSSNSSQEYRIQSNDALDIKFFYIPELNEQVIVRPDGRISLQLAKEIKASGMTPSQLSETLKTTYAPLYNNPENSVIVRSFNSQRIYVDGEVNKAGMVALVDPMTVLQAISQAGGMKETAEPTQVLIIRKSEETNKITVAAVDIEKAFNGLDMTQDLTLMPQDIVFVPRSKIADIDLWVDQYIRRAIPIPFGIGVSTF